MEKLFFDLSESEFSIGRKILLWIFCASFFLAGLAIVYMYLIQHDKAIHFSYSLAPFGISIFAGIIAYMATVKRKDHYFLVDNERIEYRYGLFKQVRQTHFWNNIKEVHFSHQSKKIRLVCNDGSRPVINTTWLERKKSALIRKHIYYGARENNIRIFKVNNIK